MFDGRTEVVVWDTHIDGVGVELSFDLFNDFDRLFIHFNTMTRRST